MRSLLEAWRAPTLTAMHRHVRVHALLMAVILDILPPDTGVQRVDSPTRLWWQIEAQLRRDLARPMNLAHLQELSHRSLRTIIRACHLATGLPPMKRIKHVRLSYARGLVQLSDLSMSEIAYRVGYGRVQEFSRDYRTQFSRTPSEDRKRGPDYRQWKA
jgi:transcriptional regulator GlxA family with amidase domain